MKRGVIMIVHPQLLLDIEKTQRSHYYALPHPKLRRAIANYTFLQDGLLSPFQWLNLVPDAAGCIILHVGKKEIHSDFWGGTTHCVKQQTDVTGLIFRFFIEFFPSGAHAFLHQHQAQYLNQQVSLSTVCKKLEKQLKLAIATCSSIKMFIQTIDALLIAQYLSSNFMVLAMQTRLTKGYKIQDIMQSMGYSQRHLQRIFLEVCGCSMKHYQQIARINKAFFYLANPHYSNSWIAQACGYYDEAHFHHEYLCIMRVSPRTTRQMMSDFYNEKFKFQDIVRAGGTIK